MTGIDISYPGAALGGLVSFLSPCVLPLVPAYLCFVAGTSLDKLTEGDVTNPELLRRVMWGAIAFVAGFTTVFVALGASASAINRLLLTHIELLAQIAGVVIIIFGLHYTGLFRIRLLDREARFTPHMRGRGLVGAYIIGLAFAFGWTPCIGPILGAVLAVAASEETLGYGMSLLAAYSLGLGIPFLIAAFGIRGFMAFMGRFRRHMHKVEIVTGGLLIVTGFAIFSGQLQSLSYFLLETFPALGQVG